MKSQESYCRWSAVYSLISGVLMHSSQRPVKSVRSRRRIERVEYDTPVRQLVCEEVTTAENPTKRRKLDCPIQVKCME